MRSRVWAAIWRTSRGWPRPTRSPVSGISWPWSGSPTTSSLRRSSQLRSAGSRASCAPRRWWPSRPTRATTSNRSSRSGNDRLSAMAAVPMKPEYGPTLGRLLAPRWRAAARPVRVAVVLGGVILLGGVIGLVASLLNAQYSQGGKVPFSFAYKGLFKTAPDPGGYVKIRSPAGNGPLEYSYAVEPLELPAYSGGLSGELPVYATG